MHSRYISDEEVSLWLAFESLKGIGLGPRKILQLFDRFQSIEQAWNATRGDLVSIANMQPDAADTLLQKRKEINPAQLLERVEKTGTRCLVFSDPLYPNQLRHIHDAPVVLFTRGEIQDYDFNNVISVVGTRYPTSYGVSFAKSITKELASSGVVIASGLAAGIDSYAHWSAIDEGRTIAVLATGPDICYPVGNRRLMNSILEGKGFVISEYFPGTPAEKWQFPARNRIIAGISKAVVVIEAGMTSGALITARQAFEQNRDVFALPGRVDSPKSEGTNWLIKNQTAQLVSNGQDIINALNWVKTRINQVTTVVELYGREREVYELMSAEPIHFEVLCEKTSMSAGEMSATLTMLELAGLIVRHAGDWYALTDARNAPPQGQPGMPAY